jgi:hypothetical protein
MTTLSLALRCLLAVAGLMLCALATQAADKVAADQAPTDASEERLRESWTATFYFENDLIADTDQNYTNGLQLSFVSPDMQWFEDENVLPPWADPIVERLPFVDREDGDLLRSVSLSLGQQIFTPDNIGETALIEDDRPYAGWLYLGVGLQTRDFRRTDTIELQLGLIGPSSLAEQAQNTVHRLRGIPRARGWDNQLRAEPAFLLAYDRRLKFLAARSQGAEPFGLDLIGYWGGSLGTVHSYANAGLELRAGWNPASDFGASQIGRPGNANAPASLRDSRFDQGGFSSLVFFAGVDGRFIARNIFLDGSTFGESHSVSRESWLGEFSAGFSTMWNGFKIAYRQVWRSREFAEQKENHSYGSFTVSYSF